MIDPHVHLRDWNQKDKETLEHGLKVARACGITRVFDMPNTSPVLTSRDAILDRIASASEWVKKYRVSYSVYAGVTNDPEQVREMVSCQRELFPLVCGLKMFLANSTGNMGIVSPEQQRQVVRVLAEEKYEGVLAVHAEKEALNDVKLFDPLDISSWSAARPSISEEESVRDIIRLYREEGAVFHLHICHVSAPGALAVVKEAKKSGMRITCGVTAHHALLSSLDAKDRSRFLKMNPPLRSPEEQKAIYQAILDGDIDWVESDHAPHTLDDKEKGASGIPGFSGTLLLLSSLRHDGVSEERLEELFGKNVIKTFGLRDEEVFLPRDTKKRFMRSLDDYPWQPFRWWA